ncbi:archaellin/type IV pilin N-terminal domain-containing protein [Candidatus Aenigmatarchaeota archaeon]
MVNRKGVSPLIAVIVLIAFTLIVAGMLATWASRFARETLPTTECFNIDVIIQGSTYDSPTSTLNLYVKNRGTIQLTFDTLIKYQNGTITQAGQSYTVDANQLRTFTFTGISNTVDEVTIQSQECTNVQDLIRRQWITGL